MNFGSSRSVSRKIVSEKTSLDFLYEWLSLVKENICLLYSHINPLLFLIILKPLQNQTKSLVFVIFCGHEKGFGIIDPQQKPKPLNDESKMSSKSRQKEKMRKIFSMLNFIALILAILTFAVCISLSTRTESISKDSKSNIFRKKLTRQEEFLNFLSSGRFFSNKTFKDPRLACGNEHGVVSFELLRCYFAKTHSDENKLNLTEQHDLCRAHNGLLSYPRSYREARFIYRLNLYICGSSCRNVTASDEWFLRVGFRVKESNRSVKTFASSDDKMIVHVTSRDPEVVNYANSTERSLNLTSTFTFNDTFDYSYRNHSNMGVRKAKLQKLSKFFKSEKQEDYSEDYGLDYDYDYESDYDYDYDYDYSISEDYAYTAGLKALFRAERAFGSSAVCLTFGRKTIPCFADLRYSRSVCFFDFSNKKIITLKF